MRQQMNMVEAVKTAGVVGAGGAGFPTHVKLNTKVECFIVNAAECEPLIETDKFLCRTYPERIVGTVEKIAAHLGAVRKVIALKKAYEAEIAALEAAIRKLDSDIEIFRLEVYYPAGDEQSMVYQVTGRSVPERGLPSDVGCVVDNVGTVLNIADALEEKPVIQKYLSVVGEVKKTLMLSVPIGTPIRDCIQAAGPLIDSYGIILGGPMMGKNITDDAAIDAQVVTKTTGNIIVLPKDHYLFRRAFISLHAMRRETKSACIQCRMCTDLCPRYLIGHSMHPHKVMRGFWREETVTDHSEYLALFGDAANCCSCGLCEMFSCPMGISPRKVNDYCKAQLRKRGIDVPKNQKPKAREFEPIRKTPTGRLVGRLGLSEYYGRHPKETVELTPEYVFIPFQQHIGRPAVCSCKAGESIARGDLLARAAEGLSANIHSSVDGMIEEVTAAGARIRCRKEE